MEATAPVTVERAATILGVSPSTIHRRIRSGALRAEQATRPQGAVWLVHLPPDVEAATDQPPPPIGTEATAPTTVTSPADAMAALIQATLAPVLAPIVAELAATRQAGEAKDATIRDQAETIGRQGAELEAEQRARQRVMLERDELAEARQRERRRFWIALAVATVLALVAVVAPGWVR